MAGKQSQGNGEGGNTEWTWLIVVVIVCLAGWALWTYAKPAIVYPAFVIDYAFIWLIEHTKGIGEGGTNIKHYIEGFFTGTYDAKNPNDIPWVKFKEVRQLVGGQVAWIISAIIAFLAISVRFKMRGEGLKNTYSLAGTKTNPSFAKFQAEYWRVATYSANFDPDGIDKDIFPSIPPTEWMRQNNIRYEDGELDYDACKLAFTEQLGKPWHGFDRASLHAQVVIILCALHYLKTSQVYKGFNRDKPKNISLHEREELSIAWAGGKDGTAAMKSLVERWCNDPAVRKIIDTIASKHAYENTVVHGMLAQARKRAGVLKEHDMLYIKRIDRNMWYSMNNCGRQRFMVESAGTLNHYFAERIMKKALLEPHVDQAIDGVENYMEEEGIDSLDEFFSAQDEHAY